MDRLRSHCNTQTEAPWNGTMKRSRSFTRDRLLTATLARAPLKAPAPMRDDDKTTPGDQPPVSVAMSEKPPVIRLLTRPELAIPEEDDVQLPPPKTLMGRVARRLVRCLVKMGHLVLVD